MRVQEHIKLSTAAALVALPWLKKDTWIPLSASVLIDVDHYLWYVATHRTLSLRAALRYFTQAHPTQRRATKLFHQPPLLMALALIATYTRSKTLWLILAGFLFHVSLDTFHMSRIASLKHSLIVEARGCCPECGEPCDELQLHTVYSARSMFNRYRREHFVALCPACHERAHEGQP
ncbi:MAG: hypothetical protein ABI456_16910 [Ktedonobacteraceae bacterium]|nr:hypothetical protein [Chloroflexota bacterium]